MPAALRTSPDRALRRRAPSWSAALAGLRSLPAVAESRDRLLRATTAERPSRHLLVRAIESDLAIGVAILRLANRAQSPQRGRVCSVPAALDVLPLETVELVARRIPVVDFFELVPGLRVCPDALRRHSVATQQLARELAGPVDCRVLAELSVAALLHDVGKLLLRAADPDYAGLDDPAPSSAELLRRERATYGVDHAWAGGTLIRRWGLPSRLAATVAAHHDADAGGTAATLRLADLLAHYRQGSAVDQDEVEAAAVRAGAPRRRLRHLMHVGLDGAGSRPSDSCPLSRGERFALTAIARGRTPKEIAVARGTSPSTVRSQIQAAYTKLDVADRAQAVLVASDAGWL